MRPLSTYKVVGAAQPLGPVLLQQALQQMPRRVGNVGFQLQRLVQDVVVHLCCVAAVERRLGRDETEQLATPLGTDSRGVTKVGCGVAVTHQAVEHLIENSS